MMLMNSHATDYCPESYALWFSYALGDENAVSELEPYISAGRRMTAAERDASYKSMFDVEGEAGQDEVMRRLSAAVDQIERSVNGSMDSAASLLDQLEQFSSSLSEQERAQFGERVSSLMDKGHEIQFMLGKSSGLLANSKDDLPEVSFELGAQIDRSSTAAVMSLATILSGLHRLCSRQSKSSRSGALLVEIDGMVRVTRDLPPSACNALVDEMARRIISIARPDFDIGRYEDQRLLLLVDSASVGELESLADEITDLFREKPIEFGEDQTRQLTVSVGATSLTMEDFPEAVVGRLSRAVQRVAMSGGDSSVWG
ncbi:MAG: hypothetical protein ACRBC3_09085 [Burkholderiaceae bacterium]